jgi:hypothetical protein
MNTVCKKAACPKKAAYLISLDEEPAHALRNCMYLAVRAVKGKKKDQHGLVSKEG